MNKKTRVLFLLACLCSIWLISCTPRVPDKAEIVIISFNDLHGDFENLPKLSAFIEETRAKYKHVIVVCAGDRFTGNPFNDYYEKRQYPIINMLNHMGWDVAVIGNHEFDFGIDLLNERIRESTAATIAANIELSTSGLVGVRPYHIIKKNGIRIAFLGLTNVDRVTGKPAALAERVADIDFFDPIETAVKFKHLRKKNHVFVALTHIGTTEDLILASIMPELDLIVGGHSHSLLEPTVQNGVVITQAGRSARHVGKTKITLEKGIVTQIVNNKICMRTWEGPNDPIIVEKIQTYKNNPFLNEPFVTLTYGIPTLEQLGHMMTDAAITLPNSDFSLMNCSGIRTSYLYAGSVTYADMLRVSPFNNYYIIVDLTPDEIREFIAMEWTDKRDCLMIPSGFHYTAIRTSGDNNIQVKTMTYPNGRRLDENKRYRVAINNYLVTKYLVEHVEHAEYTGIFVVDNMVEFLRNNPTADYRNVRTRAKFN